MKPGQARSAPNERILGSLLKARAAIDRAGKLLKLSAGQFSGIGDRTFNYLQTYEHAVDQLRKLRDYLDGIEATGDRALGDISGLLAALNFSVQTL